jgi:glycogen synthase
VQEFNTKSRNIKIVFINQFGFSQTHCGQRMPKEMEFMDIRKGSDVEFGQSIYEPFGIAQLEPLSFGGICVVSSVCGCAGFVADTAGEEGAKNVVVADYTRLNGHNSDKIETLLKIDGSVRKQIEQNVSEKVAMQVCSRLAKSEAETEDMIKTGFALAKNMSWNEVVKNYLLPTLQKVLLKSHNLAACVKA